MLQIAVQTTKAIREKERQTKRREREREGGGGGACMFVCVWREAGRQTNRKRQIERRQE